MPELCKDCVSAGRCRRDQAIQLAEDRQRAIGEQANRGRTPGALVEVGDLVQMGITRRTNQINDKYPNCTKK